MTYAKRVISILAVMAGLGAAGVFFGPHRDSALASFDGLMANLQFPLPLPGDAKIRPGVIGQSVNGAGLNVYVGATDAPVDQMFDYYSENFDVLLRQEEGNGGTLAFMAKDAADGVGDVDGLARHLFVVQAKRNPDATQTSFVVGIPQENFRLADFARTEVGDSADGDLPDVPRMPGAARVVAMDRSNLRGGADQRLFVYK
ncbi:MAG: hypothetical protein K8I02_09310, partial [Candidatus Methylomirabilis sp.]|nr:hypothetical protein [Deltaproteobacteria bacterium]